MFEESLLESAHLLRTQSRWPAIASFALQAAIAAVIITIPLLHPDVVKLPTKFLELTAPTPIPPKMPPIQRVHLENSATSTSTSVPSTPMQAEPMQTISHTYANVPNDAPPIIGTMTNMTSGSGTNNPLAAVGTPSTLNVAVTTPTKTGPARISQGVAAGLLLSPIQPTYPPIARAAHQEGTVVIHAVISKDGRIESANVVSGPAMLQGAALEAVRNARYKPYRLNGDPTEVDTTFNITFHLGS